MLPENLQKTTGIFKSYLCENQSKGKDYGKNFTQFRKILDELWVNYQPPVELPHKARIMVKIVSVSKTEQFAIWLERVGIVDILANLDS